MNINLPWNIQNQLGPRLVMLFAMLASSVWFHGRKVATAPSLAGSKTIRVTTTGWNSTACGPEANPCRTIQYAVDLANSGDTILVASGTYSYTASGLSPICYGASTTPPVICIIDKVLTLIGGYDGNNWDADPIAHPTTIDGQNSFRGIGLFGTDPTKAGLFMDGFRVVNGYALGATQGADYEIAGYGGGMFVDNAPITLRDVIFAGNHAIGGNTSSSYGGASAGGALAINGTPPGTISHLENVTFDSNESRGGSGIDRGGSSFGGGFYIYSAKVNATNIILTNNIAQAGTSSGSGLTGWLTADALGGGGVAHGNSDVTLEYLAATGNQAIGGTAGGYGGNGHGGALFAEYASMMSVFDSIIQGNISHGGTGQNGGIGGGGGIMATGSNIDIERTKIIANTATGGTGTVLRGSAGGGGLYFTRFSGATSIRLVNSVVADNYIEMGTGPGNPGGGGGGLWLQGVQIDIIHTTIAKNRMQSQLIYGIAAAIINSQTGTPISSVVNISYSAITDHINNYINSSLIQAAIHVFEGNTLNLYTGIFYNNSNDTNDQNDPPPPGPGGPGTILGLGTMLHGSMDYLAPNSPFYNFHIAAYSFAKDKAIGSTTSLDIDKQSRPYGSQADIGADEYMPFPISVLVGNQQLRLDWSKSAQMLAGAVNKYSILVVCEAGAKPPNEVACNQSVDVAGSVTSYLLTGLSNYKVYTLSVSAKTIQNLVAGNSVSVNAIPTDAIIFIPLVLK